jgi:hypothetical protein
MEKMPLVIPADTVPSFKTWNIIRKYSLVVKIHLEIAGVKDKVRFEVSNFTILSDQWSPYPLGLEPSGPTNAPPPGYRDLKAHPLSPPPMYGEEKKGSEKGAIGGSGRETEPPGYEQGKGKGETAEEEKRKLEKSGF